MLVRTSDLVAPMLAVMMDEPSLMCGSLSGCGGMDEVPSGYNVISSAYLSKLKSGNIFCISFSIFFKIIDSG